MTEIREDEYLDPADGLIHCRKCGGPRQAVIPDPFKGGSFKLRCVCPCQQEAEHRRREAEERRQRMERIKRRKAQGLQDRYLYGYTFANDNGENPAMAKAHAYVDHWPQAFKRNIGLLLFGDVGTGKSFAAGWAWCKILCKRKSTKSRRGAMGSAQAEGCIPWPPGVPAGGAVCTPQV